MRDLPRSSDEMRGALKQETAAAFATDAVPTRYDGRRLLQSWACRRCSARANAKLTELRTGLEGDLIDPADHLKAAGATGSRRHRKRRREGRARGVIVQRARGAAEASRRARQPRRRRRRQRRTRRSVRRTAWYFSTLRHYCSDAAPRGTRGRSPMLSRRTARITTRRIG